MERLIELLKREEKAVLICSNLLKMRILEHLDEIINVTYKTPIEATNDILGYYDDIAIYEIKKILDTSYEHAKKIFDVLIITNNDSLCEEVRLVKGKLNKYYHKPRCYDGKIIVACKMNRMLDYALKNREVIYYEREETNNIKLYEYDSTISEVEALANRVAKLIDNKENDIIIYYNNKEYIDVINDIFPFYNINYNIDSKQSLYDIDAVKRVVEDISNIDLIEDERIKKKVVQAINNLVEYDYTKEDLIDELKKTKIGKIKKKGVVEIKKYDHFNAYFKYSFIIGKSNNIIPSIFKDNDYYSDETYNEIGLMTSFELNQYEKYYFNKTAKQCQNMVISYAKAGISTKYDEPNIDMEITKEDISYEYSSKRANLTYMKDYFAYLKYGKKSSLLKDLNATFPYETYDSSYKLVNEIIVKNKMVKNGVMNLSYTKINNYISCPFAYFCKYILDLYEPNTISTNIGNYFHFIFEKYYSGKSFNECLIEANKILELEDVYAKKHAFLAYRAIKEMDKQMEKLGQPDKILLEKTFASKLEDKPNWLLTGKIDKLLTYGDKAIIIDYKTGKDKIKLDDSINQLIIYLLLLGEYHFSGIFIQHVLPSTLNDTLDDKYYQLNGYYENDSKYDGICKGSIIDETTIEKHKIEAIKAIEDYEKMVLSSQFQVNPKDGACKYCAYAALCYRRTGGEKNAMDDGTTEGN